MNKTLFALISNLEWQLNDLHQEQLILDEQGLKLDKTLQLEHDIWLKASVIYQVILPEQEMARLQFMLNQEQKKDALNEEKKRLLSQQEALTSRKNRLNLELKMLEKYQANQAKVDLHQMIVKQQNATDDWAMRERSK